MKVFISGPMSGKPNYNRAAFFKAQEELEKHGYSVWNPAWLAYPSDTEFTKDDMHIIDFAALRRCDAIYMLKGWQDSKGARAEYETAKKRGLLTMYEDPSYFGTLYKHSRVAKPINDCYSIYDYIGPNKIDSLEKQCNDLAEDIKDINGDIEGQYRRLNHHNNRLMSLTDKINGLNQAINDVEADLDNFKEETDGKMNDIYDTLHRHGENLDTSEKICANRYAHNFNKINKLEKDVKSIKESIDTDERRITVLENIVMK